MKKYTYTLLMTALMIVLTPSCSKDFLETRPVGRTLELNHYQSQEQAFEALVAIYDVLQWNDMYGFNMFRLLMNTASDEAHAGGSDASDQPSWVAFDNFTMNPNLGPQAGFWKKSYRGIYRANYFLEVIETTPNTSAAFVERTTAEAKFLRAKFYFDLLRLFGNAPLILEPLSPDQYYNVQMVDQDALFAQVEQDLTEAIVHLPVSISGSQKGRASKGAAQALLARAYLFMDDNDKMDEVAALCEAVINSGEYALEQNYGDIFTLAGEHGVESVFEISYTELSNQGWWQFQSGGGEGNVGTQFIGMRDYDGPTYATGWGFCPVSTDLVTTMGTDPRRVHTIIDVATDLPTASYSAGYQNTGYFMRKYAPIAANLAPDGDPALNWGTNVREIRYADVLLMAAEGLVRSGGSDATALGYVNQVRNRAGVQPLASSGATLLADIYTERQLELALEGHRYFDLIRTGQAATVLASKGFNPAIHNWLPIPQNEIDASQGALTQNPGY